MNRTLEEWKDFIHTQGYVEVLGSVVEWAKAVDDLSTLSSEVKRLEEEARVYREAWEARENYANLKADEYSLTVDLEEAEYQERVTDAAVRSLRGRDSFGISTEKGIEGREP